MNGGYDTPSGGASGFATSSSSSKSKLSAFYQKIKDPKSAPVREILEK
jgi:hypothetical protein